MTMSRYLEALKKFEETKKKLKECQAKLKLRKKKPVRPCQSARKRRKGIRKGQEDAAKKAYAEKMSRRKK